MKANLGQIDHLLRFAAGATLLILAVTQVIGLGVIWDSFYWLPLL